MDIPSLTIDRVRQGLLSREFSAAELATEALRFAEAENPKTNAYLHFSPERALAAAERVDDAHRARRRSRPARRRADRGQRRHRHQGVRTTCGSRLLANYIPPYDATAVTRLEEAGGVILGKTNCDEFAMGSSNENSAFGPVRNPVALDRVPGGSSGGSAAVVAQGTAVVSLGSDTGGSIRQPASFCGVVGVTPTYGRVSRYGLTAFASSLDHIGPFARTVKDAATVLSRDRRARSCAIPPPPKRPCRTIPPHLAGRRKRLEAWPAREYLKHLTSETGDLIAEGVDQLESAGLRGARDQPAGHRLRDRLLLHHRDRRGQFQSGALRWRALHLPSPASDTLSDMYRNTRGEGFGAECKRRIMLGTYVLSAGYYDAYYLKAQKVRTLIARDFANAFQEVDAIVAPVSPFPAFKLGEKVDDPLAMYLSDIYTITGSLAGIPCMSVPCGNTAEGLPVGMQILTKHFDETTMFRLADAFENVQRK